MKNYWLSLHIFYNSDHFWLLTECMRPLVNDLEQRHMVENYFAAVEF